MPKNNSTRFLKMFKQIALAAALVVAASAASAQQISKFYAGVDIGSTRFDDERETGFGGFVGYKINQNFAIEGAFHRLAKYDASYSYDSVYGDSSYDYAVGAKVYQSEISLIVTLPLSKDFSFYNRLGYNHLKFKADTTFTAGGTRDTWSYSSSENKVVYGVGLSYAFTPALAGRVEVQKPHSELTKVAIGLAYSF